MLKHILSWQAWIFIPTIGFYFLIMGNLPMAAGLFFVSFIYAIAIYIFKK